MDERQSASYKFWAERGGTPHGWKHWEAAIPVTLGMRFWILLDQKLIGGADDGGCHYRPTEVDCVLGRPRVEDELLSWFGGFFGEPVDLETCKDFARDLLREIGSGRAVARNALMRVKD